VQVTYKKTEFLHDQVLLTGFASGGLTEVRVPFATSKGIGNLLHTLRIAVLPLTLLTFS
jgi:hypothetical protein